jgi:hypothetical protein
VVPEVERLGNPAEADGVLVHTGDRHHLVDAARRDDQPVVGRPVLQALGVEPPDLVGVEVDGVHLAGRVPYARREGVGEGDGDAPRLEDAARHLGQQRQVEEVVGGADDHDLDRARVRRARDFAVWKPAKPLPMTTTRGGRSRSPVRWSSTWGAFMSRERAGPVREGGTARREDPVSVV